MSQTYSTFLSQSPEFRICRWGRGHALGFRGTVDQINSAWYLFVNYDKDCVLHWLRDDFAYISMTLPRLRSALKLYLYVNILHSKEAASHHTWDEAAGTYDLIQDIATANELAEADVAHFMASLQTKSFIPLDESTPAEAAVSAI